MTNRDRVLAAIRSQPGMTDAQIRRSTGIEPHQQVNQICRGLAKQGYVLRRPGRDGRIINLPAESDDRSDSAAARHSETEPAPTTRTLVRGRPWSVSIDPVSTLLVIPCSAKKVMTRSAESGGSVLDSLPSALGSELAAARLQNATVARVDESQRTQAVDAYDGMVYRTGASGVRSLMSRGATVLIISGGYGLVFADETIGSYSQVFRPSMWQRQLVGRCISALAEARKVTHVVGLLSASTDYSKVFVAAPWNDRIGAVQLLTPERTTKGAQVKAPRAQGEALRWLARESAIDSEWRSSDGLRLEARDVAERP